MILLEMYLDGQLIDSLEPSIVLLQSNYWVHVNDLVKELKNKHAAVLSTSGHQPVFILSGIPSSINFFTPLQHPETF